MAQNNSFPKQYILDRIDARVARLKSFQATDDAVLKQHSAQLATKNYDWICLLPADLDALKSKVRTAIRKADAARKAGNEEKVTQIARDLSAQLKQFENNPPSQRHRGYGYKETDFDRAVSLAHSRESATAKELIALEHARAYLQDTPVAEFSWTALKALGLIDAVKFDLTAATDAAAGR